MKVNQAKQRLGPRIQAEASSVTQVANPVRSVLSVACSFILILMVYFKKMLTEECNQGKDTKLLIKSHTQITGKLCAFILSILQELRAFGDRCESLAREFSDSEAFNRKCPIYTAFTIMDTFGRRLEIMESEAQASSRTFFLFLLVVRAVF